MTEQQHCATKDIGIWLQRGSNFVTFCPITVWAGDS